LEDKLKYFVLLIGVLALASCGAPEQRKKTEYERMVERRYKESSALRDTSRKAKGRFLSKERIFTPARKGKDRKKPRPGIKSGKLIHPGQGIIEKISFFV
jgi:hypothetical protein